MRFSLTIALLVGATQHAVQGAPGAACSSGIYKALLPLSNYAPAESYCSQHYPQPAVTVTATQKKKVKRATTVPTTTTMTTKASTTTSKTSMTTSKTTSQSPQESQWSSLLKAAGSIISTACSCIETPVTVTVSSTLIE